MELTVSPAPHIHDNLTVSKCMYNVIIALLPAFAVSLYFFGIGALIVTLSSILSCVIVEYLIQKYLLKEKPSIGNGSAILTGLLLAFNLPSNLPIWIVVIGSIVAIGIAKMSFGGLGNNLFNPALAGRVFLLISFPTQMTQWPRPIVSRWNYTDTETGATLLSKLKEEGSQWIEQIDIANLWIGNQGGSLGEVGAIALLIGYCLSALPENHQLAYTRLYPLDSLLIQFRLGMRARNRQYAKYTHVAICIRLCPHSAIVRRTFVRGYIYGDRLRDLAHDLQRNDYLRNRYRYLDRRYTPMGRLPRRSFFRNPYHECFYTAYQ